MIQSVYHIIKFEDKCYLVKMFANYARKWVYILVLKVPSER